MVPTHATKHGVRYRYYVSLPYRRGHAEPLAGAITRVPAAEIEEAITKAVAGNRQHGSGEHNSHPDYASILGDVGRVEVMRPPVPETILVNHQITGTEQGG
jgi:site-specific DNA recombinase